MTIPAWFVQLTDRNDDPVLVNLAHVTHIQCALHSGTLLTFVTREALLVQEPVETLATVWDVAVARFLPPEEP